MLETDLEIVEALELNEDHELDAFRKKEYVEEQLDQMKKIIWRLRVDRMLLAHAEARNDDEETEKEAKMKANQREIDRMAEAVTNLTDLKGELKELHPES